ncbi:MAG: precorrin-2 C(20)-methyltransferase [Rikenellaceae bacterium]
MKSKIIFVSLGPGDPELVTLKGFKTLQNSDVILCPSTISKDGREVSRSEDIVVSIGIEISKVRRFIVPMSRDREQTLKLYREVAELAVEIASSGQSVAITAEGDAGFYSSAQYINDYVEELGVSTDRISGVPAFIDCARLAHTPLVSGDSSVEIMAYVDSAESLIQKIKEQKSIVLMKISQREEIIKEALRNTDSYNIYYIESCGVDSLERIITDREEVLSRKFPYFAIIIIKPC